LETHVRDFFFREPGGTIIGSSIISPCVVATERHRLDQQRWCWLGGFGGATVMGWITQALSAL
jgi:hypothetical protein